MTYSGFAAIAYAALATIAIFVQLALAVGKPWGALTLGGRWQGVLPLWLRPLALLQAMLLIAMTVAVMERGQLLKLALPGWSYTTALVITALSLLANAASPSQPERRLWTPVIALMLLSGVIAGIK